MTTTPAPFRLPALITSGAQTGADQAALRAAVSLGLPTGGWVPFRCQTEDGPAPWLLPRYGLTETATSTYKPRTRLNATRADATVVFGNMGSPGSYALLTVLHAADKPVLENPTPEALAAWSVFRGAGPIILNVGGNRASKNPHLEAYVYAVLVAAFWPAVMEGADARVHTRRPATPVDRLPILTHQNRTAWTHPDGLSEAAYVAALDYRVGRRDTP